VLRDGGVGRRAQHSGGGHQYDLVGRPPCVVWVVGDQVCPRLQIAEATCKRNGIV
jgi:hypothetical protein